MPAVAEETDEDFEDDVEVSPRGVTAVPNRPAAAVPKDAHRAAPMPTTVPPRPPGPPQPPQHQHTQSHQAPRPPGAPAALGSPPSAPNKPARPPGPPPPGAHISAVKAGGVDPASGGAAPTAAFPPSVSAMLRSAGHVQPNAPRPAAPTPPAPGPRSTVHGTHCNCSFTCLLALL
jgi:hypothetical protein